MKNLVIFDFGTSKIKILIQKFSQSGDIETEFTFANISIGKLLSGDNVPTDEEKAKILEDFKEKITTLITQFPKNDFEIRAIATEIFRKNKELENVLGQITSQFGIHLEILTPERECELLAANFDLTDSDLLLDVGGGSVNTIYKRDGKLNSYCYSLGAYVLHNLFQSHGEIFDDTIYANMDQYIKKFMDTFAQAHKGKFTRIILGSNQMLSFFNSLSKTLGLNFMKDGSFSPDIIEDLMKTVFLNKKYEDLFRYFDKNPSFMYGADKMMLVLKNFVEFSGAKIISPTDAGISLGFARICRDEICGTQKPVHVTESSPKTKTPMMHSDKVKSCQSHSSDHTL